MDRDNQTSEVTEYKQTDDYFSCREKQAQQERQWRHKIINAVKHDNAALCKLASVLEIGLPLLGVLAIITLFIAVLLIVAFHFSGFELLLIIPSVVIIGLAITYLSVFVLSKLKYETLKATGELLHWEEQEKEKQQTSMQKELSTLSEKLSAVSHDKSQLLEVLKSHDIQQTLCPVMPLRQLTTDLNKQMTPPTLEQKQTDTN